MSEQETRPVRGPRINPFAFPSETTLRFVLLVIFVLCGTATFYEDFHGASDQAAKDCASQAGLQFQKLLSVTASNDRRLQISTLDGFLSSIIDCEPFILPWVLWQMGGMGLVIVVAAIIYCLFPTWEFKTRRLEPIDPSELPEVAHELQSIAEIARLPKPPVFVWSPLATGLPVVFGGYKKYYVALSAWFIAQYFYGDRTSFRAIMLHELAHIRNGDVHKTFLTLSLCLAFLVTTLTPGLFIFFWRLAILRWWDAVPLFLNGILWTSIVVLSGLAVLRARECYADVRASTWDQASRIDRVLAALSAPVGKGWRRYFQFHPDPGERRQIVEDPSRLLRLRFADALGIGIAAWSIVSVATRLLLPFIPRDLWAAIAFIGFVELVVPAIVFILAIGAIAIGVWRSAFASLLKGDHPSKGTGWLGAAFVAGAFPTLIVPLAESALESFDENPISMELVVIGVLAKGLAYTFLLVGCLLIFRWIADAASAWFEIVLRSRSPRPLLVFTVASTLLLVVVALSMALYSGFVPFVPREGRPAMIGSITALEMVVVSLAVWAFPIAGSVWPRQAAPTGLPDWVFLDRASPQIPRQAPVHPGEALMTGLVLALIYLLLLQPLYVHNFFPAGIVDGIQSGERWLSAWTKSVLGGEGFLGDDSAIAFQMLAAAIVAARARRLGVVYGVFAASVAGFVIVLGDYLCSPVNYDFSAWINASTALTTVGEGAVVAVPTAIVVAWLANRARRLFADTAEPRQSGDPARAPAWSDLSKWSLAALYIVVGTGVIVRINEVRQATAYRVYAERGDRDAQVTLGYMYAYGVTLPHDDAKAVLWWRKAAERGNPDAQFYLSRMFLEGRGVAQDDAAAVQWVRRAAEQGHAVAQNDLAIRYALGRGVPRNDTAAVEWFRKAAERGNADAKSNLGVMYQQGRASPD